MPNVLHRDFTLDNNHALNARLYADIAARDADTAFQITGNIDKLVKVTSPLSYWSLAAIGPTVWIEYSSTSSNQWTELTDTPGAISAGLNVQGNAGGTALEFGQDLRPVGVPEFAALGIGITPVGRLHVYEDTAFGGPSGGVTIEQDGTGDAMLHFLLTGGTAWISGIDTDQADAFKIQPNNTFNSVVGMTIATGGNIGFGILPDTAKLRLVGATGDTVPFVKYSQTGVSGVTLSDFYGSNNPEGLITALASGDVYHRSNGIISGLHIFKGATPGNTGWQEVSTVAAGVSGVTTSDTLTATQLLLGNGGVDVVTEPDLVWDGAMFGVGIANPVSRVHFFENTTFTGPSAGLTIEQMGTGDAMLQFLFSAGMRWIMGVDNDDGDKFKINDAVNFSVDGAITIQPTTEYVGFGTNAADTRVDVSDSGGDAIRVRSGNASGAALNQMKLSLDSGLLFSHAIKTRHHATNQFSNAIDFYLWDADTDADGDVGTLPVLTMLGDGKVGVGKTAPSGFFDILSSFGDTTPVIQMASSSNPGTVRLRVGDQNPDGAVSGIGPDVYFADRGALSGSYESLSASTDQIWFKRSVFPSNIIELQNSTQLDDLASAGVITIAANTSWHVRGALTTANRIVINAGIILHITGEFNSTSSIAYSGTLTFVSGSGALRTWAQMSMISTSTGTFLDIDGGPGINLTESSIIGWDDLGTIANTGFLTSQSRYLNIGSGLTLTNTFLVNASVILLIGSPLNSPLFTINLNNPDSALSFENVEGNALGSAGSLFDLDTRINNSINIKINQCSVRDGNLFKQSVLTDATINSVADGSPATGTITAMADNGSGGTTISSTTTYFEDEEVTITGTTSYNGTFQIFNVVAGVSFDTITAFVADDATGSVDSNRLTLALAGGHGISIGDSIKIINTNFYNGFKTTLNVVTNDITVNGVFVSSNTGSIERELSVDGTDRRVRAADNNGFVDSHFIACAHVNDNSTAVGTIVNNTFTDLVFGTTGDALIASTTMERWKLVNEIAGIFEYIGQEPFDGNITFDYTVESTGGSVDFRLKWEIDEGAGFVNLPDNVEALTNVGSDAQSVTKTFPLRAVNGDLIKSQITRNSGSSGITLTYGTIYVTM